MLRIPNETQLNLTGNIRTEAKTTVAEARIGNELGKGGGAVAYECLDDPNLIVRVEKAGYSTLNERALSDSKNLRDAMKTLPEGIGVARIVEVGIRDGELCQIMEKAPGSELHQLKEDYDTWRNRIKILADAPQEHYDKFVTDGRKLAEAGYFIDPSKPNNFFYCDVRGFTYIDLLLKTNASTNAINLLPIPLVHTNLFYRFNGQGQIDLDTKADILKILQKCQNAGIECSSDKCCHSVSDLVKNL